ncbi:MAG: HDIG domain-containing protein [Chloroflexota bacterium]|nr:HDIG domain-containing protein [Chloroflexota bacterium]
MFIPRTLAQRDVYLGRGPAARAVIVTLILAALLTAILTLDFTPGQVSVEVGSVAQSEIRAPRTTQFVSPSQTKAAQDTAAAQVLPQYAAIAPAADIATAQLRSFELLVQNVTDTLKKRDDKTLTGNELTTTLKDQVGSRLTNAQITQLAGLSTEQWQALAAAARAALAQTQAGSIREEDLAAVRVQLHNAVTSDLGEDARQLAGDLAASFVAPNERYSQTLTDQARQAARNAVAPVVVPVQQGETIVRTGDLITAAQLEKLEQLGLTRPRLEMATVLGDGLLALLIAVLLVAFLWRFQPQIWHRTRSLLLFCLALVVSAIAIRVAGNRSIWTYAVPTAATVLLIGILLEGYAAAAMAAALAVLAGIVNPNGLEPAVFVLTGGMATLLAIVRAERLNAFLRAGLFLALTNIAVVVAFGLLDQTDLAGIAQLAGAGAINAFLSVVLAVGSFAMLGNLFGIMTVFQLLELANPSNRLLRRLLLETPGTYHHAVMVGNLAERAAETIGADPLLVRVAAYYHDIGKMKNPLAFIENQAGARNIHDELDAETSARIIAAHIRDGIDLGYENGLPVQIIGFIPQHHGTSVMSYFYGKALTEAAARGETVDRERFRYPGPKPQSREAAILMLSDGVEASVRSLDSKDEASIRSMVERIVDARVEDGQLDDAELTLKDLADIKEAFVAQLLGMYHSRIQYPDNVLPLDQRREATGGRPAS